MRVLLLGAPGSGKGTQGERIANRYRIAHVSSGELLRAHSRAGTEVGRAVRPYLARGDLVPDELVLSMIRAELATPAAANGYVLDGFPRTLPQARAAEEIDNALDAVLFLDLPPAELIARLDKRADRAGRVDDQERSTVQHRLRVYEERTRPLLDHYRQRGLLIRIDAAGSIDEVAERIATVLDRRSTLPADR
ncbi:MAG: adenylate kinase, partial [Sporichthyaceae bacterium]|nr:adenylate kinase [Sporichthyaceae bacterium]